MKKLSAFLLLSVLLFSCANNKTEGLNMQEYFYPLQKEKQAYIYLDSLQPLDEKIHVFYVAKQQNEDALFIEMYKGDVRLTEGYTFKVDDSITALEHMVIDRWNQKRKTELRAQGYLPGSQTTASYFNSSFPSHLDSVSTFYESKKMCINTDTSYTFEGKTYPAILVRDSIKMTLYNSFSGKGKSNIFATNNLYAKGLGLVAYSGVDGKYLHTLQKILNQNEWEAIQ